VAARRGGARALVEAGTIALIDERGKRDVGIAMATADIGAALAGAELVVVPSPAIAQADIARAMAPHLKDGQVVFLPPGTFGSFVMARIVRAAGLARRGGVGRDRAPCPTWRGSPARARCG
jgi:opine dehydrogenase